MFCPKQLYCAGISSPGAKALLVITSGGTAVGVAGTRVSVGIAVGGNGVVVGSSAVGVGGNDVDVGGTVVGSGSVGTAVGDVLGPQPPTAKARKTRKRTSEASFFIFAPPLYRLTHCYVQQWTQHMA